MSHKFIVRKNLLDLQYRRDLQVLNTALMVGTIGLLSFIATFVWKQELLLQGLGLTTLILAACVIVYYKTDKRLRGTLDELKSLG